MPTITALERQERNAERVNVYLDGNFAFGLNVMDAATLRIGQLLTEAEVEQLQQTDAVAKAVEKAIQFLSYRPRSTHEIRQALQRKQTPAPTIDAALDRLQTLGYLDDRAFARLWVESRNRSKPLSTKALRYELRRKGIADTLIAEVLQETVDDDTAAYQALARRVHRLRGRTQREFRQKMGAFLQQRGFNYSVARQAIDQWIETLLADEPEFFANNTSDSDE